MKGPVDRACRWERETPDSIWLTQPWGGGEVRDLTWRAGMDEARRVASWLRSLELPAGSRVAILSKNCAHWLLADLAIWMAGHVSVPLYSTASAATVAQILAHSEARVLFAGKHDAWEAVRGAVPDTVRVVGLPLGPAAGERWEALCTAHAPLAGDPERGADELATIVYTSGSTGTPKGVMVSFGAMARASDGGAEMFRVGRDDRMLSHLPLAHVAERALIEMGSLSHGFRVYFVESLDTFVADLRRARPTLFFTVPRLWQKFQLGVLGKVPPQKLDRLLSIPLVGRLVKRKILRGLGLGDVRLAGAGAAPMPADLLVWYRRLGLELLEGYGMSENFGYSHATRPGRVRPGYVGEASPGVEHRIAEDGEVQVKSPGMMSGYFREPELTAETFTSDGWLKTGDRGEIDELGRLRITGRVKELFKTSKARYVAPAPIESKVGNHPLVEAVCVMGAGQPQPFALVMLGADARRRPAAEIEAALAEHLRAVNAELEPHEHLALLAVVRDEWLAENGFLTPTMKIRRAAIEAAYAGYVDAWYASGDAVAWQPEPAAPRADVA